LRESRSSCKGRPMTGEATSTGGDGGRRDRTSSARARRNAHVRKAGVVRIGPRYPMLDGDDGLVWRLKAEDNLTAFAEQRVTIEGRLSAADELTVLWVGPETAGEAGLPSE
jgi:hypothetical protein